MLSDVPLKKEGKGDAPARGEQGQHPGHDGGISGGQILRTLVDLERHYVNWM